MKATLTIIMIAFIVSTCKAQTKVFNKDRTKSWWVSDKPGFYSDTAIYKVPQLDTTGFYIKTAEIDLKPIFMIECFRDTSSTYRLMKVYINRKRITWTSDSTFIFKIQP